MICPICKSKKNVNYFCEYKFEVKEDKKYFGDLEIVKCKECDFCFANPMPKSENLDFFYENIYRLPYRPPYWFTENEKDSEKKYLEDRNLNYLLYISTLIDLRNVDNLYDFGAGVGDLGFAIKKKFPKINLFCTENDKQCLGILNKRGYTNKEIEKLDTKFDLIITTHSLEHLKDLNILNKFHEILKPGGLVFFEIPNCPEEYFSGRPYDGPHLLFYTKKSIKKIGEKFNFDIVRIDTSSYSFVEDYKLQKESQDRYYNIQSGIIFNLKKILKKFIPKPVLKMRETFLYFKNFDEMNKLAHFSSNSGDNTYLRGILKKK